MDLNEIRNLFLPVTETYYFCTPKIRDGIVAQMVEQRTENPCVTGSIPVDATEKKA
jgi:hypothetical protein